MVTLDRHPGHREEHLLVDVDVEVVEETGIVLLLFDCHFTGPFLQELERVVGVLNTRDGP